MTPNLAAILRVHLTLLFIIPLKTFDSSVAAWSPSRRIITRYSGRSLAHVSIRIVVCALY